MYTKVIYPEFRCSSEVSFWLRLEDLAAYFRLTCNVDTLNRGRAKRLENDLSCLSHCSLFERVLLNKLQSDISIGDVGRHLFASTSTRFNFDRKWISGTFNSMDSSVCSVQLLIRREVALNQPFLTCSSLPESS